MTQEDKELLLEDLCARLPYGVKVYNTTFKDPEIQTLFGRISYDEFIMKETYKRVEGDDFQIVKEGVHYSGRLECIKPFLRPMSSMTEEEFQELHNICPHSTFNKTNVSCWIIGISGSEYGKISRIDEISKLIDWLNEHHFDFRGLIERGLAIEATYGIYSKN